jgi:ketosteroid isomerase-like protein
MASNPTAEVRRLHEAMNRHDLDAFVACFDPHYRSEQPAHPNRAFGGYDQVRTNWATFFAGVPDFHAELLRGTAQGDTAWSEWAWSGHRHDGSALDMRGVIIMGIQDGRIAWGRLYMEEAEQAGADIDATMRDLTRQA